MVLFNHQHGKPTLVLFPYEVINCEHKLEKFTGGLSELSELF